MDSTAVHGTLLVVDVAGFGDLRRTNRHQLGVRRALYRMVEQAFTRAGIPWDECRREDRGDGILVVAAATVAKSPFVDEFPRALLALLTEHNARCPVEEQIRLRVALHAGELHHDEHGVAGRAVNLVFRLVDAPTFREVVGRSLLGVVTSSWFYEEVVFHSGTPGYFSIPVEVKETSTTAWVWVSREPAGRVPPAGPVPRQLPATMRQFVGRRDELGRLTGLLRSPPGTVIITAIDGSAGIGKTALALHWAHQVKDEFPDGQLHVNLRGFDRREPMDPGQVLHDFLWSLGVASVGIPAELDAKAALYRSLLVGKRMLVVLDNARSAEHVRPLLPGTSTCVTIITSRNRLDGLVVHEGAHRISLDVLPRPDALALLAERVPRHLDPRAATELMELCARLPLALSVVAARVAELPESWLLTELRAERDRLDVLDLGEVDLSVRAVFSWSYAALSPSAARLFRLLGVHPGPDVDLDACTAILGEPARTWVRELTRAHLLTEYRPGRFRFHDLLRVYATELAERDPDRQAALERMLDHYLETAEEADYVLLPYRDGKIRRPSPNAHISAYEDALAWFAAEDATLAGLVDLAADNGFAEHTWRLALACSTYLRRIYLLDRRIAALRTALAAIRVSANPTGQIIMLRDLASAITRIDRTDEALTLLAEALEIAEKADDVAEQVSVHLRIARAFEWDGKYGEALARADVAARLAHDAHLSPYALSRTMNTRGRQLYKLGRLEEALSCFEPVLATYLELGHSEGIAEVLASIGAIRHALGQYESAISHFTRALEVDRQLGDLYWQAVILDQLGDALRDVGESSRARAAYQNSLELFQKIHHADAECVLKKLGGGWSA